jgi:hypothetical protein
MKILLEVTGTNNCGHNQSYGDVIRIKTSDNKDRI